MQRSAASILAWNVFRFCTALRGLGSLMILLVLSIVGVTYFSVVVTNYGPAILSGGLGSVTAFAILILFHGLIRNFELGMLLWCILMWSSQTLEVFHQIGGLPQLMRKVEIGEAIALTISDISDPMLSLQQSSSLADSGNPRIRYCRKCNQLKPPRCHHCSVCGRCILKMDHHCVWVVNCVGSLNYKYFLLFLFYTFLETSLVTLSLLPNFAAFFNDGEISDTPETLATTFLTFALNLAFAQSILGFLIMHVTLVLGNTTTMEAHEKRTMPKRRYDLGRKKNFEQAKMRGDT